MLEVQGKVVLTPVVEMLAQIPVVAVAVAPTTTMGITAVMEDRESSYFVTRRSQFTLRQISLRPLLTVGRRSLIMSINIQQMVPRGALQ
jgi:hypothetical protein